MNSAGSCVMITRNGCGLHVLYTANPSRPPSWVFEGGDANLLLLTGRPHRSNYDPVAAPNDPEALFAIMSVEVSPRWPCAAVLLLLVAAVSCSVSIDDADNVLPVDGFGNEEIKESNLSEFAYPPGLCLWQRPYGRFRFNFQGSR